MESYVQRWEREQKAKKSKKKVSKKQTQKEGVKDEQNARSEGQAETETKK